MMRTKSQIKKGRKFNRAPDRNEPLKPTISPSAFAPDSATCRITAAQAAWNGESFDITVSFKYQNLSTETWAGTHITAQLVSPLLGVVDEKSRMIKVEITSGETHRAIIEFASIAPELLVDGDRSTIVLSGYGCTGGEEPVGAFAITETNTKAAAIQCPVNLGNEIRVVSLSISRSEPDEDRSVITTIRALLQNLSTNFIAYTGVCGDVMNGDGQSAFIESHGIALGPGAVKRYEEMEFSNAYDAKEVVLSVCAYSARASFVTESAGIEMPARGRAGNADQRSQGTKDPLAGRRVRIRFPMTKGDGDYPELSKLPRKHRTVDFLASHLSFNADWGEAAAGIKSWHMVDDGLAQFREDGYPAPVIDFILKRQASRIDLEEFRTGVSGCFYSLVVPGINDGPEDDWYLFEDQNGYTHIVDVW